MKRSLLSLLIGLLHFCAYAATPTISWFYPAGGSVGTLVTITGTNLGSPTSFIIGGVAALVVSNTGTSLVGMVMPGATTGAVSVSTSGGTAASSGDFSVTPTPYPHYQLGGMLTGADAIDTSYGVGQGCAVAISANGTTAIVGGSLDNNYWGAAWIYVRNGAIWTQQGPKLVGSGGLESAPGTGLGQGSSVAISADGNTVAIGGIFDDFDTGAVWIFTRTGSTWTQQGQKLAGTGTNGVGSYGSEQGTSVAISADGNTLITGAPMDNSNTGAVWTFVRTGSTWTQLGSKLVASGSVGAPYFGYSLSLSADGQTALVGGSSDNNGIGAAWVYTRSGSNWIQQGPKLVGTGASGLSYQGSSVALSADARTALVGGYKDDTARGAAWVFVRSGSTWTQQGAKLVGTGAINIRPTYAGQGGAVALSADGNTAMVGGSSDSCVGGIGAGAVWVYTRAGGIWTQQGHKLYGGTLDRTGQGSALAISSDGSEALVGAPADASGRPVGRTWAFGSTACPATVINAAHSICPGGSYSFAGRTLTTPGTYLDTLASAGGCDSIVTLHLSIDTVVASFSVHASGTAHLWYLLNSSSSGTGTTYTWSWGDGSANSTGDTPSHTYSTAGHFNICVTVTDGQGCSSSHCDSSTYIFKDEQAISVNVVRQLPNGLSDMSTSGADVLLQPNPATSTCTISIPQATNSYSASLLDLSGREVAHLGEIKNGQMTFSVSTFAKGIYLLRISDSEGQQMVKKLVVE